MHPQDERGILGGVRRPGGKHADAFVQVAVDACVNRPDTVQRMLALREDIFPEYSEASFVAAFQQHFRIVQTTPIADTVRTLYLMERP